MNLYADIAGVTLIEAARDLYQERLEAARKVLAARWAKVNPGVEHRETITETTRLLGNGREEPVLVIRWGTE